MDNLECTEIQSINLGMPVLKEVGARWLVQMVEYISNNPQFIVNGFVSFRISSAINGVVEMGAESEHSGTDDIDSTDSDNCEGSDD